MMLPAALLPLAHDSLRPQLPLMLLLRPPSLPGAEAWLNQDRWKSPGLLKKLRLLLRADGCDCCCCCQAVKGDSARVARLARFVTKPLTAAPMLEDPRAAAGLLA